MKQSNDLSLRIIEPHAPAWERSSATLSYHVKTLLWSVIGDKNHELCVVLRAGRSFEAWEARFASAPGLRRLVTPKRSRRANLSVGVLRTPTGWPPWEAIQLGLYLGALLEEPLLAPRPEQGGDRSFGPAWRGGPMGGAAL